MHGNDEACYKFTTVFFVCVCHESLGMLIMSQIHDSRPFSRPLKVNGPGTIYTAEPSLYGQLVL